MVKPTRAKTTFVIFSFVILSPLFLNGGGAAAIIPVLAIFWLDGLVQAMGVPVSVNGGVDAFNLVPPNALGTVLILLGSAISLGTLSMAAKWLFSPSPDTRPGRGGGQP